jgi:AraC family transcriptional regulator
MIEGASWNELNRDFVALPQTESIGMQIAIVDEDLGGRPAWSFKSPYHSVFVHLEGHLASNEAKFENGPSTTAVPSVGGVWMVPAEQRFDALPKGRLTRFCEIRLPMIGPDSEIVELSPQIDIRDGLLYEAAKVFQRQAGPDDVSKMSSRHLAEAVQWHVIERYDLNPARRAVGSKALARSTKEYIVSYINDMVGNRITLEDLAKITSLDIPVLLKKFYASFGTTPAQYIIRIRIERAKALLASSSLPIGEIATVAGFHSPSHFCVSFMKHVGIAPMAFRQSHR